MVKARDTIVLANGTVIKKGETVPESELERIEQSSPNLLDSFAEINNHWYKISELPEGTLLPDGTRSTKGKVEKKTLDEAKVEKKVKKKKK